MYHQINPDDDLPAVLRKMDLTAFSGILEEQEVDLATFLTLSNDDLTEIGMRYVLQTNS